jgi:hypothetical protein
MVVLARDIVGMAVLESERDAVLIVHPQATSARPITLERFETIAAGQPQIAQ